jgi:hypothetical protein
MYVPVNITTNLTMNLYSHRMAFQTSLRVFNDFGFRGKVTVWMLLPMSHFKGGPYNVSGRTSSTR